MEFPGCRGGWSPPSPHARFAPDFELATSLLNDIAVLLQTKKRRSKIQKKYMAQ